MLNNLVQLDEFRPHIDIFTPGKVHTYPLAYFFDVAAGKRKMTQLPECDEILQQIIKMWLDYLLGEDG